MISNKGLTRCSKCTGNYTKVLVLQHYAISMPYVSQSFCATYNHMSKEIVQTSIKSYKTYIRLLKLSIYLLSWLYLHKINAKLAEMIIEINQ